MKTFSKFLAIVLAAAGAATLAGCSKSAPNHKTATSANWNVRTSTSVEENSFDFWQTHEEVAEYSVSHTEGTNTTYGVEYNDGATYSTRFYMTTYDWTSEDIPVGYRATEATENTTEFVYVYETSLTISGKYKMKSGDGEFEFSDELITISYFRPAKKNLQPVYSYQKVKNTSPATLSAGSISSAYVQIDEVYETFYNRGCSEATVVKTTADGDNTQTKKIGLSSEYSNFDNSQLRAAIRAFTLSGGSSRTFYVVTPQNDKIQSVSASISSPVQLNPNDNTQMAIINTLTHAAQYDAVGYIFFDGSVEDENATARVFRYNAVSLGINESLQGTSPTMWYLTVENNDINSTRCVLLRMSTPIAFGMGTLNYNLNSLKFEERTQS